MNVVQYMVGWLVGDYAASIILPSGWYDVLLLSPCPVVCPRLVPWVLNSSRSRRVALRRAYSAALLPFFRDFFFNLRRARSAYSS